MSSDPSRHEPGDEHASGTPGLVFWVWVLVFAVFIALTVYITVAG